MLKQAHQLLYNIAVGHQDQWAAPATIHWILEAQKRH